MDTSAGGGVVECFAAMQCPGHGGVWEAIMSQKGVQWVSKGRLLIFSFDVCFGSISLQTAACDDQHSHRILLDALNQTFPLNSAGLVFRFICYSYRFYYLDYFQNWKSLFEVCSSLTMVSRSRKQRFTHTLYLVGDGRGKAKNLFLWHFCARIKSERVELNLSISRD